MLDHKTTKNVKVKLVWTNESVEQATQRQKTIGRLTESHRSGIDRATRWRHTT